MIISNTQKLQDRNLCQGLTDREPKAEPFVLESGQHRRLWLCHYVSLSLVLISVCGLHPVFDLNSCKVASVETVNWEAQKVSPLVIKLGILNVYIKLQSFVIYFRQMWTHRLHFASFYYTLINETTNDKFIFMKIWQFKIRSGM